MYQRNVKTTVFNDLFFVGKLELAGDWMKSYEKRKKNKTKNYIVNNLKYLFKHLINISQRIADQYTPANHLPMLSTLQFVLICPRDQGIPTISLWKNQ